MLCLTNKLFNFNKIFEGSYLDNTFKHLSRCWYKY